MSEKKIKFSPVTDKKQQEPINPAPVNEADDTKRAAKIFDAIEQKLSEYDGNVDHVGTWIINNAKTVKDGYIAGAYLNSIIIRSRLDNLANAMVFGVGSEPEDQPQPAQDENPFDDPAPENMAPMIPIKKTAEKYNTIKDFIDQDKTNMEISHLDLNTME